MLENTTTLTTPQFYTDRLASIWVAKQNADVCNYS